MNRIRKIVSLAVLGLWFVIFPNMILEECIVTQDDADVSVVWTQNVTIQYKSYFYEKLMNWQEEKSR